jgi:two-component system, chemotaxis family, sensor kinase CheA
MSLSDKDRALVLETFRAEAGDHLRRLEEMLVALESRANDAELLQEIFRTVHSLKGDAAMVGFPEIADFAHRVEDLLDALRDGQVAVHPEMVTLLLRAVDVLRALMTGDSPADLDAVRAGLGAARAAGAGPAGAAETAPDVEATAGPTESRTLRIEVAKLDRMLDLTGEIAIARGRIGQMLGALPDGLGRDILEAHLGAERLQLELQEQVTKARMVPVGPFFRQYGRTVRDLAHAHGKSVRLQIEGEDVEVDTRVVERLRDPLTHMLRNAIDHGIESAELRAALGKTPEACVTLRAAHDGGSILIEVSDDGAGFNRSRIAQRLRETGLASHPEALADGELLASVFAPGFSTAETVTDLSGRGVGMDIVRHNIDALRGTIDIASVEGAGSTITVRLPLTLAIIDGFGVGVGGETFVIPLDCVLECIALPPETHEDGAGNGVVNLRGEPLPFVRLRERLAVPGGAPRREHVVVVQHAGARAGLAVDELFGERQAVIKSLGTTLESVRGVSGSTILGDGRVALILDVPALLATSHVAAVRTTTASTLS